MEIQTLQENEWVSLKKMVAPELGISGYVFSHETRCKGQIVSFLPFRKVQKTFVDDIEFMVRKEMFPCWSTVEIFESSFTGGIDEGDSPSGCVLKELHEEAGIVAQDENIIHLGICYGVKSTDTIYHLFAVDVSGLKEEKLSHFESELEKNTSTNLWMSSKKFDNRMFVDPFLYLLHKKLMMYIENQGKL